MKVFTTHSTAETEAVGMEIAKSVEPEATIALFGPMGMGKTALVRGMAKGLHLNDSVSSPTFAIVHDYSGRLIHFDMYRISSWDELYNTGFFEYLNGSAMKVVEWSENIENALPDDCYYVQIKWGDNDDDRIITLSDKGLGEQQIMFE